jgi:Uma2 family endonuclease
MELARVETTRVGEPVWELALLFPYQGDWTEEEYLALDTNRLIEYTQGYLEVLPMPTMAHQDILLFLFQLLNTYVRQRRLGRVYVAPLPVRLGRREYREPDLLFVSTAKVEAAEGKYPNGADLVVEIVSGSPADRDRDLVRKRRDYALAGIPEYWIVDPEERAVFVLRLEGGQYVEHGRYVDGQIATSSLLPGFSVPVDEVWRAAEL